MLTGCWHGSSLGSIRPPARRPLPSRHGCMTLGFSAWYTAGRLCCTTSCWRRSSATTSASRRSCAVWENGPRIWQPGESELAGWDRTRMWERLWAANPKLRSRTREFIDQWHHLAMTQPAANLESGTEARMLIQHREHSLKGTRARLSHPEARDNRSGYPSSARLQFRWPQARRIAADILEPL